MVTRLREKQFSRITGAVLDVACGTGENFPHLKRAASITAFDLSLEMVDEAKRRTRQMRQDVALSVGDAEAMPYPDDTFDNVVSALSSCTFSDHVTAFREMVRVTKPGGRLYLVEHGRSSVAWIARRQDRNIARQLERAACRNNRDVTLEIAEAGLDVISVRTSHLGMMNRIIVRVS
jgi:ubiquinone/menaquinone biosynthesis C-methylase UbiE